jgi:hypothetical protein
MAGFGFVLDTSAANDKGGAIPDDWYLLVVVSSEIKQSKAGNDFMKIDYQVAAGEYEGCELSINYNFAHDKPNVRELALADLRALGRACGYPQYEDVDQIIGIPFYAHVTVQPGSEYTDAKTGEKKMGFEQNNIPGKLAYLSVAEFDEKNGGQTEMKQIEQQPDRSTARSTFNGGAQSAARSAPQDERPLSQRAAASGPASTFAGKSRPWGAQRSA